MMKEIILSTHNLCKNYGGRNVVDNVSLTVHRGEVYGFVGLNGAGKTTLMRAVSGLINPSAGDYTLFGKRSAEAASERVKTAAIIEGAAFYPSMTGRENIAAYLRLLGKNKKPDEFLATVGLDPELKTKAKAYSLGMKQRLSLAMALAADAELLLLDEPTNGLDPEGMYEIRVLLKRLAEQHGVTIFISSHILSELSKLATTYGFIHKGRLIKEVSSAEIEGGVTKCHVVLASDPLAVFQLYKGSAALVGNSVEITADITAADIVRRLDGSGITVNSINTRQADLESYFRTLISGVEGLSNSGEAAL